LPTACYFFGFIYGNVHRRKTDRIKYEKANQNFVKLHALPRATIYAPMIMLNLIYIVFFVALSSYLFSAFTGNLPLDMTYSEYARRGFFELCAVSVINLGVIAFTYTFGKREEKQYPKVLKALTAVISFFTILLVATAISKMLLYMSSYGLTRLRVYSFWFLIVILFVFGLILIWHFKPFNLGKYLIIGVSVLFMALAVSNTDGLIAEYNIENYENGKLTELDTEMLSELSAAVYPHVSDYAKRVKDPVEKQELKNIAQIHKMDRSYISLYFRYYNIQLLRTLD
jgi:predicted membrane channel-forming protein YqfA (hemolysin III family)